MRRRDEGRGEVWRDKGSYAAEGQLLVAEWVTKRLSAAVKWRYPSDAAKPKNMAPCMCAPISAHRNSHCHGSLIENAAGELSVSYCFMNTIYKALADCAALLVVSAGRAVVKVMTDCE